jgi:hypothetical protein
VTRRAVTRRAAIELAVSAVSIALAIVVVLVSVHVRGWERGLTRGDARFAATPLPPPSSSDAPARTPPPILWQLPHGTGARLTERLLGLRDDVEFRRALALYRAALPNANEQQQFQYDQALPEKRILAQRALTDVSRSDSNRQVQSRALNMLGILLRGSPTPSDPVEQRTQILAVIGLFRSAIRVDPGNEDAKLNLELILRDPQTEVFVGPDPGGTPDAGNRGGMGVGGQGY